jgi:hypothetical protein
VSATAALARRPRALRSSRFPGVRLKQSDVAQALSGEEPVAVSTFSAWDWTASSSGCGIKALPLTNRAESTGSAFRYLNLHYAESPSPRTL